MMTSDDIIKAIAEVLPDAQIRIRDVRSQWTKPGIINKVLRWLDIGGYGYSNDKRVVVSHWTKDGLFSGHVVTYSEEFLNEDIEHHKHIIQHQFTRD